MVSTFLQASLKASISVDLDVADPCEKTILLSDFLNEFINNTTDAIDSLSKWHNFRFTSFTLSRENEKYVSVVRSDPLIPLYQSSNHMVHIPFEQLLLLHQIHLKIEEFSQKSLPIEMFEPPTILQGISTVTPDPHLSNDKPKMNEENRIQNIIQPSQRSVTLENDHEITAENNNIYSDHTATNSSMFVKPSAFRRPASITQHTSDSSSVDQSSDKLDDLGSTNPPEEIPIDEGIPSELTVPHEALTLQEDESADYAAIFNSMDDNNIHLLLPPGDINVVAMLQQGLVKYGCKPASYQDPIGNVTLHAISSYFCTLTLSIRGDEHVVECDARWRNKKDAKRNVAYKACKSLGFLKNNTKEIKIDLPALLPALPNSVIYKGQLQQKFQGLTNSQGFQVTLPTYSTNSGAPFESEVTVTFEDGRKRTFKCSKTFDTKKKAEQDAAKNAYETLEREGQFESR